jgi:NAD-dependent deacetylase
MIFILTGAGISRESGLDTFRDKGGVWERYRVEDVATPEAFARDPARVLAFYDMRRRELVSGGVAPNAAHVALARLEREAGEEVFLLTQNVDDLHERGGSSRVVHMHGELLSVLCGLCGGRSRHEGDLGPQDACPSCGRAGGLRPDVVWFGEMPYRMEEIAEACSRSSLFVSVGTSGSVYPAAGLVRTAKACGARTLELNLEPSLNAGDFDEGLYGPATRVVPAWVDGLLAGGGGKGRNGR